MPNPENLKYVSSFDKHMNVNGIHEYLDELKKETFSKYDIMTVGEANGVKADDADLWVGEENGKFNMVFQFEHLDLWDYENNKKFDVKGLKKVLTKWQNALHNKGWNALFIENHDIPRVTSTWGNDNKYLNESAKAFGLVYFMQEGTPFIYQGQEIGMTNVKFDSIEDYDDVKCINIYKEKIKQGLSEEEAMKFVCAISRDNARTPMQWNAGNNAGFTSGKPWIQVNPNYKKINVDKQILDNNSILNFYKNMIKIKKGNEPLIYGEYNLILEEHDEIYAYTRSYNNETFIVIANLTDNETVYSYDNYALCYDNLLLSNYDVKKHENLKEFKLNPWEARIYRIDN